MAGESRIAYAEGQVSRHCALQPTPISRTHTISILLGDAGRQLYHTTSSRTMRILHKSKRAVAPVRRFLVHKTRFLPTHPYVLGTFTVSVDSCKVLPLCSVQQLLGDSSKITTRLLHVIVHFKYLLTSLRYTIVVLLRPSCLYGHMYIIMISFLALFTQKHKMHQLA